MTVSVTRHSWRTSYSDARHDVWWRVSWRDTWLNAAGVVTEYNACHYVSLRIGCMPLETSTWWLSASPVIRDVCHTDARHDAWHDVTGMTAGIIRRGWSAVRVAVTTSPSAAAQADTGSRVDERDQRLASTVAHNGNFERSPQW